MGQCATGAYDGPMPSRAAYERERVNQGPVATAPRDRDTIPNALARQEQMLSSLHGLLTELENRLVSVLELGPADPTSQAREMPNQDQVLGRIEYVNIAIGVACSRVDLINRRLLV